MKPTERQCFDCNKIKNLDAFDETTNAHIQKMPSMKGRVYSCKACLALRPPPRWIEWDQEPKNFVRGDIHAEYLNGETITGNWKLIEWEQVKRFKVL